MLLSREAPSPDLRRSLSSNYPSPSGLPTAGQQCAELGRRALPSLLPLQREKEAADEGVIRRQRSNVHSCLCPHSRDLICRTVVTPPLQSL